MGLILFLTLAIRMVDSTRRNLTIFAKIDLERRQNAYNLSHRVNTRSCLHFSWLITSLFILVQHSTVDVIVALRNANCCISKVIKKLSTMHAV